MRQAVWRGFEKLGGWTMRRELGCVSLVDVVKRKGQGGDKSGEEVPRSGDYKGFKV